jgi:hypothetical protein
MTTPPPTKPFTFFGPRPGPYRDFIATVGGTLLAYFAPVIIVRAVHEVRPLPDGAVMGWLTFGPAVIVGFCIAAVMAAILCIFTIGRARFFDVVRWPWLALAIIGLGASLMSWNDYVMVYQDRAVIQEGASRQTLDFAQADSVRTRCIVIDRRKKVDVAGIDYVVVFRSGATLDLGEAAGRNSPDGMRIWFRRILHLDRTTFSRLPHQVGTPSSPDCVQRLQRQFTARDFGAAARMIGLTGQPGSPTALRAGA